MKRFLPLLLLAACTQEPNGIVGPFTGESRRFVVDSIQLPRNNTQARDYGADLNGDNNVDNQLGMVFGTLASEGTVTEHGNDMIGAGVIASSVIITADDFTNDPTVSVLYLGADGDTGIVVGGSLSNGVFTPNRTRETTVPGAATLHLPTFVDADPSVIPVLGLEIELTADGHGGFNASIHGGVPHEAALTAAYEGIQQMIADAPAAHPIMRSMVDMAPRDGVLTRPEFDANGLIASLLSSDVQLGDQDVVSIGFRAHFSACPDGRCAAEAPPSCFDRVANGDETDVDCGGSCDRSCAAAAACTNATDCDSQNCSAGVCGAPSCSDGILDGLETDVDCGYGCGGCAVLQKCLKNADCASGQCGPPCAAGDVLCDDAGWWYDTCRP